MSKSRTLIAAMATLLAGGAVHAQTLVGDVKACRQMTDPAQRLACYDAMRLPAEPAATAPPAPVAAAPVVAADPVAKFGQEAIKPAAGTPELKQIESRIPGKFRGWGPNTHLTFENGQVWRIADGSSADYNLQDPKVTVHRGMLGAFYLEIEGIGFQMRVVRVR
jgi:hypothetical protein